jgi:hypothetical protein
MVRRKRQNVNLTRGASWLPLPRLAVTDGVLKARLQRAGKTVDALEVTLRTDPLAWQALSSRELRPTAASTPLDLPVRCPRYPVATGDRW